MFDAKMAPASVLELHNNALAPTLTKSLSVPS